MAAWTLAILCQSSVFAEVITWKVVAIADGDTLTVLDRDQVQHQIRLVCIDAPENTQAHGQRSKKLLSELDFGREVIVETNNRDRYRRDVNLVQVERGMAWWYRA